jgi:hypothetical protein
LDTPLSKTDGTLVASDYTRSVDQLLLLYTGIDRVASSVPAASVMPFLKFLWNAFKFYFALIGDVLLIVPINVVVFVRNIFPGPWSYKCFCCRYLKAAARWIWMGEGTVPVLSVRPIVISLLHWHFRKRLLMLRGHILLATAFSEDEAKGALAKIERAMDVWQQRTTVRSVVFGWGLPLLGPATALWNSFVPADLMPAAAWTHFAVLISVSYALAILSASFLVKRGLMLGASGNVAQYPGFVPGAGHYAEERRILSEVGLQTAEFPLDIAVVLASMLLSLFNYRVQIEVYEKLNWVHSDYPSPGVLLGNAAFSVVVTVAVALVALVRRKRLGRV